MSVYENGCERLASYPDLLGLPMFFNARELNQNPYALTWIYSISLALYSSILMSFNAREKNWVGLVNLVM